MPNGPFQAHVALDGPAKHLAMGKNADGRMELFYIGTDDHIYHTWQGVPNGPFQPHSALGGVAKQVTVGKNADGRMEVFYIGTDDHIYHNWQGVPNGPFQGEAVLGDSGKQIAVGQNADGRMELFYVGTDDHLFHRWQGVPNGPFHGPGPFYFLGTVGKILDISTNLDGRLELFYQGEPPEKGAIVVRGLDKPLIIPNQANIEVETQYPSGVDTPVKITSVRNPHFMHQYSGWEDPAVVSVQGSGNGIIPAGKTKFAFTLVAATAGFAWIMVEADGYLQVEDVGPQWSFPNLQMVNVFTATPVSVQPSQHEMNQGDSFALTLTMASAPWKDCPVQLLLAHDSPLQGHLDLQPNTIVIPAGQKSASVSVKAIQKGPVSGDLSAVPLFNWAGASCHITIKGAPTPPPPPPPPPTPQTYSVPLKWKPGSPMYVQSDPVYASPTSKVLKVGNKNPWGHRCSLLFPNNYLLKDGAEATPNQLGLPDLMLGMVVKAIPGNPLDGQQGQWDVWIELTHTT